MNRRFFTNLCHISYDLLSFLRYPRTCAAYRRCLYWLYGGIQLFSILFYDTFYDRVCHLKSNNYLSYSMDLTLIIIQNN